MKLENNSMRESYPLARTEAVGILSTALERLRIEKGLTQREIARELGYKGSVVLSHMALGRVPIPVERAVKMAEMLGIEPRSFLVAVLEQRFPEIDFKELLGITIERSDGIVARLEAVAGKPLELLDGETIGVLEQVLTSNRPARRWLSLNELPIIDRIRTRFPEIERCRLTSGQIEMITACIAEGMES